jgi:hypothetical protein
MASKLIRTRILVYIVSRSPLYWVVSASCILFGLVSVHFLRYVPAKRDYNNLDMGENFLSELEIKGRNWVTITEIDVQTCYNIERKVKKFDNCTENEREVWSQLNCLGRLRDLYSKW